MAKGDGGAYQEEEKLLGLLHAPLGLNLGPRILSIIGSSIVTVGLECEHTDCQAGNPTSLEAIQSISKGDVFDADMVLGTWNLRCHAGRVKGLG
ncbi:hypothetical protein Tco_1048154 [Tanacetum coccineum]